MTRITTNGARFAFTPEYLAAMSGPIQGQTTMTTVDPAQCYDCAKAQAADRDRRCTTCARLRREVRIALAVVEAALDAGHTISVCDSEEFTLKRSRDAAAIKAAMFTADSDLLVIRRADGGERVGFVSLIYGNDCDVLSDYTASDEMESLVKPAEALAERLGR